MLHHMGRSRWMVMMLGSLLGTAEARTFDKVTVVPGGQQTAVEKRIAQLLADRMTRRAAIKVAVVPGQRVDALGKGELAIVLGVPKRHRLLAEICRTGGIPLPTACDPGGEGFVLKSLTRGKGCAVVAAGVDERGELYAVGEILRRMIDAGGRVAFPVDLHVRTAPAFKVRGLTLCQGHTMRQLTGARAWTEQEWQRVALDYALAGANTLTLGFASRDGATRYEFVKSYGLDVLVSWSANIGSGPPEWRAVEAIGRQNFLCPSVPEARQAILEAWEARWRNCPPYDYLRIKSGDGGGCECDRCRPFGAVYIRLVEDMAKITHRYSPNTRVFVANQKLDNAGERAIFDYVNEAPRPWMAAFCYGPGSDAMGWMPGRRQDHRMDLFDHPGFGPHGRYLQEILHQLPPTIDIVMFTDLTHWIYSQYGLMDHEPIPDRNHELPPHWGHWLYDKRPDPAFEQVYNRRTFHARPRHYHRVFRETMGYTIGDVAYSEGHHDHLNTWLWQRLLWSPHRSVEDIVGEYARLWFGPQVADTMAQAIFQLEENLSVSQDDQRGVDRLVGLVWKAGHQMPAGARETNYLWGQYMQKAMLDKYVKLREARQRRLETGLEGLLAEALRTGQADRALKDAKARFEADIETSEMKLLRAEAGRLGTQTDAVFGVRNVGYFNLDRDLIGLGWLKKQVAEAQKAARDERQAILHRVVHYEDPGKGGFYDNAGSPSGPPHLTRGWPFGDGIFSEENRRSQRTMVFTTDEDPGVTFEYRDLDRAAHYRVRLTLVRPAYLPRFAVNQKQTSQSIFADDVCLAKDLELPVRDCRFFEFDIPEKVTQDGELRLWFRKSKGIGEGPESKLTVWRNTGGWGTLCSEVWLMKKR